MTALLWILLTLFVLRVAGQALVAFFGASWLPAMEHWYSGVIPYPWLLLSQILLIALMAKICLGFNRGEPKRFFAGAWLWFGYLYLAAMIARAIFIGDRPIPIFFHWVLATFVIVVGHAHRQRLRA